MEFPGAPELHPAFLQPGTLVGPWRVLSRRGRGSYGVVYLAVKDGQESAGPVALKIALMELDSRFERELEMLSRVHHPSIPRPKDHGFWRSPGGMLYPYIVMEWVEGTPLYDWAAQHNPSPCAVYRLLAQAASALAATHAAGGVHRDVKGDNVLVKQGGDHAVLLDFGLGHHSGAETLTPFPIPPATPAYRSPEAWRFAQRFGHLGRAHHVAQPKDDLFALGVMAYRLVTEQYPPPTDPGMDGSEVWHVEGERLRPPRELNPRVPERLDALILKMLSVNPEERGTARELADALARGAESTSPEDHVPLFGWETLKRSDWPTLDKDGPVTARSVLDGREVHELGLALAPTSPGSWRPFRVSKHRGWLWLALVASAVVMPLVLKSPRQEAPFSEPVEAPLIVEAEALNVGERDGGTVDLGDGTLTSAVSFETPIPYRMAGISGVELPKNPLPGQRRPPCPGSIEIQGGCWLRHEAVPPDCPDIAYEWRGGCYVPILSKPRPSSSDP